MYKRINKNRNNKTPLSASAMLLRFWVFLNVNMNNCAIVHTTPSFIQFICINLNLALFWSSSFGCPFRPNGINSITISHQLIDVSSSLTHVAAHPTTGLFIFFRRLFTCQRLKVRVYRIGLRGATCRGRYALLPPDGWDGGWWGGEIVECYLTDCSIDRGGRPSNSGSTSGRYCKCIRR